VERLEHEADLPVPEVGELVLVERLDGIAVEEVPPRGRAIERADHVERRRLARPARAHDRDHLSATEIERHAAERADLDLAHSIRLLDGFEPYDGRHAPPSSERGGKFHVPSDDAKRASPRPFPPRDGTLDDVGPWLLEDDVVRTGGACAWRAGARRARPRDAAPPARALREIARAPRFGPWRGT
jgi:hypothetical protein